MAQDAIHPALAERIAEPDETGIPRLLAIMAALRDPKTGCPWDIEQSFASIAPYTIEEAHEVADDRWLKTDRAGELGQGGHDATLGQKPVHEAGPGAVAKAASARATAPAPSSATRPARASVAKLTPPR